MSDPVELAVAVLFAVWFVASIVAQLRGTRAYRIVKRADKLDLLPNCLFFAPDALDADYHLVVGWQDADGAPLTYARARTDTSRLLRGVWNPAKRRIKVVLDSMMAVIAFAGENPGHAVDESAPYRKLLELAHRYVPGNAVAVRFVVIRTFAGSDEPEVIIRSFLHPVCVHDA